MSNQPPDTGDDDAFKPKAHAQAGAPLSESGMTRVWPEAAGQPLYGSPEATAARSESTARAMPKGAEFAAGDIVGSTYEVVDYLGRGAMGFVYRAKHIMLAKEYALKTLGADQVSGNSWRRFQNEAQAIAKMNHPNVVSIHNFGLHKVEGQAEIPFYVMDLLQGCNLGERLRDDGVPPLHVALRVFEQAAAGLGYAHSKGIVHRDVKPGNIVLLNQADSTGATVKIVDFGIAKLTNTEYGAQKLTTAGEVFGSPLYMSPEQSMGQSVDARSDIYSLGVALFETLNEDPPFVAKSAIEIMIMHQGTDVPQINKTSGIDYPPDVQLVLDVMMAKEPARRYQTMEQVSADFASLLRGQTPAFAQVYKFGDGSAELDDGDGDGLYAVDEFEDLSEFGHTGSSFAGGRRGAETSGPLFALGNTFSQAALSRNTELEEEPEKRSEVTMKWVFVGLAVAVLCVLAVFAVVFKPPAKSASGEVKTARTAANNVRPATKGSSKNGITSGIDDDKIIESAKAAGRKLHYNSGRPISAAEDHAYNTEFSSADPLELAKVASSSTPGKAPAGAVTLKKGEGATAGDAKPTRLHDSASLIETGLGELNVVFSRSESLAENFGGAPREPTGSQRQTTRFSKIYNIDGVPCRQFDFPTDTCIGCIVPVPQDSLEQQAIGMMRFPAENRLRFRPGRIIGKYPQYVRRFQPGDIYSIILHSEASTDKILDAVSYIPGVVYLNLTKCKDLTSASITALNRFTGLSSLDLSKGCLSGEQVARSNVLDHLKSLDWSEAKKPRPVLLKLQQNRNLMRVGLPDSKLTHADYEAIANLSSLQVLDVSDNRLTLDDLKLLSKLPRLTYLNVKKTGLTRDAIPVLRQFKNLRQLQIFSLGTQDNFRNELKNGLPQTNVY